jgi:hypothetical protein
MSNLPRVRQAVLAARELEPVTTALTEALSLAAPFADPGVSHFGLRNAVFAIGDTFLEVVSPVQDGTSAGRLLDRRGGDCGYMVMFQVEDLAAARARAARENVREVLEVELDDIAEVHLHPADMGGAIVSLSTPQPAGSWRWGGPEWERRSAAGAISGLTLGVRDPELVAARWETVIGGLPGIKFVQDDGDRGPLEIAIEGASGFEAAGVRFVPA